MGLDRLDAAVARLKAVLVEHEGLDLESALADGAQVHARLVLRRSNAGRLKVQADVRAVRPIRGVTIKSAQGDGGE